MCILRVCTPPYLSPCNFVFNGLNVIEEIELPLLIFNHLVLYDV